MTDKLMYSANDAMAKENFSKARFKAFYQEVKAFLTRREAALLPFDEIRKKLNIKAESYIGIKQVPIDKIVGSENRYNDFTRSFAPRKNFTEHRWVRIDTAHQQDTILPPVSLYEVGGVYFVRDGNHRISVAKTRNVEFIDAEVISLNSEIELSPDIRKDEIDGVIIKFEKEQFFKAAKLKEHRPDADIPLTSIGGYPEIIKHIEEHRVFLSNNSDKEPDFKEAALSWYDSVYSPVINLIEEKDILRGFKNQTKADLYLWIAKHMKEIEEEHQGCIMAEDALDELHSQKK
jgi:hypothetical protein